VHDHADKQHHGELGFALFAPNAPAGLKDYGENDGVNDEHEYRVKKRPGQSQGGAFVPAHHFASGHLRDELAIAPEAFAQGHEGRALGGVGVSSLISG
jgi:hypothetical protein